MPKLFSAIKKELFLFLKNKFFYFGIFLFLILATVAFLFYEIYDPKPTTHIDYGVTFSPQYASSLGLTWEKVYLATLDDLKVNNFRLVAYWEEIEKNEGEYSFTDLDWMLGEAQKRNVNVILAIGKKVPRWPECHVPDFFKNKSEPEQERALLKLLEMEINHFKKFENIKMWEVENEPYFPYGECKYPRWEFLKSEVALVRSLDNRPILIQDSGEGGLWFRTYALADYLGISMYRRIWYDFWGVLLGKFVFFTYPLPEWSYPLKAKLFGVPLNKVKVLELQAEPWGDGAVNNLSRETKDKTLSRDKFLETISYAQKTGIDTFYFWGVEWWYWEKYSNNEPFFWDVSKAFWK